MSYIHHIFDFIILCTIFSTVHLYFQQNLQFSLGYFIYITQFFFEKGQWDFSHTLCHFLPIYDSAPSPSPDTASALAFPVSLQPHSGVYTNAKGQISSSLVLLDSPFSVADCWFFHAWTCGEYHKQKFFHTFRTRKSCNVSSFI